MKKIALEDASFTSQQLPIQRPLRPAPLLEPRPDEPARPAAPRRLWVPGLARVYLEKKGINTVKLYNMKDVTKTYLANDLARAFLQLTFWLLMNESTVTAMARSMSWEVQ